jgi:hypothetical protein
VKKVWNKTVKTAISGIYPWCGLFGKGMCECCWKCLSYPQNSASPNKKSGRCRTHIVMDHYFSSPLLLWICIGKCAVVALFITVEQACQQTSDQSHWNWRKPTLYAKWNESLVLLFGIAREVHPPTNTRELPISGCYMHEEGNIQNFVHWNLQQERGFWLVPVIWCDGQQLVRSGWYP